MIRLALRRAALLLGLTLALVAQGGSEAPVSLRVTPTLCLPPCTVRVTVRVPRHAANRRVTLSWTSEAYAGLSEWPLDGLDSPTQFVRLLADLPRGIYRVGADLTRQRGHGGHADVLVYAGAFPEAP